MSGDGIQAVQTFECADDAEVILKGWSLLEAKPEHPAIEIWEGKRMVARLARNTSAQRATENIHRLYHKPQ
jgi:hypothetical protein